MKNNLNIVLLILLGIAIGIIYSIYPKTYDYGTPAKPDTVKTLSESALKALAHQGEAPVVVFSLTRNGSLQAFVPQSTKVIIPTFPLHAENIISIDSITFFSTSNPKFCWASLSGDERCIVW